MVWSTNPRATVDYLEGAAFFGGRDASWAAPADTYVQMDSFVLVTR